jgi:hypothetical protein
LEEITEASGLDPWFPSAFIMPLAALLNFVVYIADGDESAMNLSEGCYKKPHVSGK